MSSYRTYEIEKTNSGLAEKNLKEAIDLLKTELFGSGAVGKKGFYQIIAQLWSINESKLDKSFSKLEDEFAENEEVLKFVQKQSRIPTNSFNHKDALNELNEISFNDAGEKASLQGLLRDKAVSGAIAKVTKDKGFITFKDSIKSALFAGLGGLDNQHSKLMPKNSVIIKKLPEMIEMFSDKIFENIAALGVNNQQIHFAKSMTEALSKKIEAIDITNLINRYNHTKPVAGKH